MNHDKNAGCVSVRRITILVIKMIYMRCVIPNAILQMPMMHANANANAFANANANNANAILAKNTQNKTTKQRLEFLALLVFSSALLVMTHK
jgi:hypothetical protein